MKVAVVSRNFSCEAGGAESYAVHLAQAMRVECEVTVVAQKFGELASGLQFVRVPRLPFRSRWINQLWFDWYSKRVTRGRFDIVHSHENVTHGQVQTVHVSTVHARLREKGYSNARIWLSPRLIAYLWIERHRLGHLPAGNVFVSEQLMDETIAAVPGLGAGTVIPPGVNWPEEVVGPQQRSQARRALGLSPYGLVIGFVGHDFKKKGLGTLLRAVALLRGEAVVLVVGRPDQSGAYRRLVESLGAGKECRFLGVVRDMSAIYAAIDCLAHPTTQDVFPMVLLEAMALGTPVITTVAPYNTMACLLVNHQQALLLDDPADYRQLAALLDLLAADDDLRRRLSDGGRQFSRRYSWSDVKRAYYAIYTRVRTSVAP
jgi:UDP-glucose:(heptosyl)LPS alpha-1,3-glucosyltransferase